MVRLVLISLFFVISARADQVAKDAHQNNGQKSHQEANLKNNHSKKLVKVRLKKDLDALLISGTFKSIGRYQLKGVGRAYNLKITEQKYKGQTYWFVENTKNKKRLTFKSKRLTIVGKSFKSGKDRLPPHFVLWDEAGKINVVAELPMDLYLQGVLAGEMPLSWPKEALKAQAIASKSYALSVAEERKGNYFHLDGDVYDQVYKYTDKQSNGYSKKLTEIINETSQEYLVAPDGHVLKAYYHANSGGKTELPYNVWQDTKWNPHYASVSSPDANRWSYGLSRADFIKRIQKEYVDFNGAAVQSLAYNQKSTSGRVTSLKYLNGSGETIVITGQKLRELVGFGKIKSTFFTMVKSADQLKFFGKGFGHGVGMSQNGANQLARKGWNYKNILKHFYPKVEVQRSPGSVN